MSITDYKRIVITPGEPAGIGPDICIKFAQHTLDAECVFVADPDLLAQRAKQLQLAIDIDCISAQSTPQPQTAGRMRVLPIDSTSAVEAGRLDPASATYVMQTLDQAVRQCQQGRFDALVTGPVHKGNLNNAGILFSGHTEYLCQRTQTEHVVMMLATDALRVALATTHLPLRQVADAITATRLEKTITVLHTALHAQFGIAQPRILVCGLNPHAGEGGHLGREEQTIIEPLIAELQQRGLAIAGPYPADTIFTAPYLARADVILAMYHDQGLPVLKYSGFSKAVNVTLGLPIVRTSVDHGTALELAGKGTADAASLHFACQTALTMLQHQAKPT